MSDARNNLEAAEYEREQAYKLREQLDAEINRAEALQTELDAQIQTNLTQTQQYYANQWAFETKINNLEITNRALVEAANRVGADLDFWQAEALEWAKSFGSMRQAWERADRIKEKLKLSLDRAQSWATMWFILNLVNLTIIAAILYVGRK
jgi:chromosome segregation ATPase